MCQKCLKSESVRNSPNLKVSEFRDGKVKFWNSYNIILSLKKFSVDGTMKLLVKMTL